MTVIKDNIQLGCIEFKNVKRGISYTHCCKRKLDKGEKYISVSLYSNKRNYCYDCWKSFVEKTLSV